MHDEQLARAMYALIDEMRSHRAEVQGLTNANDQLRQAIFGLEQTVLSLTEALAQRRPDGQSVGG